MKITAPDFQEWLTQLPVESGFARISASRPYSHEEERYDAKYGVEVISLSEGRGLCNLLKMAGTDKSKPALEVGCGSGRLTAGLADGYPGPMVIATDPSPAFLRLAQRKLGALGALKRQPQFAILNGEDLGLFPPGQLSLITMRSTLHHILDVDGFISACARAICHGGAIAMGAEPIESGYVLMGAVAQAIVPSLELAGICVTLEWQRQIGLFTDTMKFYCRRDLDKTRGEDKHLFRIFEMAELGRKYGLRLRFFPNAAFEDFMENGDYRAQHAQFGKFMLRYLRVCMGFDPALVDMIADKMQVQFAYIEECYSGHAGPIITGAFLFVKEI